MDHLAHHRNMRLDWMSFVQAVEQRVALNWPLLFFCEKISAGTSMLIIIIVKSVVAKLKKIIASWV